MILDSPTSPSRTFTESPIATLLSENLLDLSDIELDALQREISTLVTAPGALSRALTEESTSLRETKTATRKPRTKKHDVSNLI